MNTENLHIAFAALLSAEVIEQAELHSTISNGGKSKLLCSEVREIIPNSFQIAENNHILKFIFRQMVFIQELIDQSMMIGGKCLLFFV